MALAGQLEIQLIAGMARLSSDLGQGRAMLTDFAQHADRMAGLAKSAFASLGLTLGAGAFVALIKGAIDAADHLNDLSKSTGIAVEQLAGLRIAAKQSGGDLDSIAASINKLSVNIGKDGDKFRALGVTAKEPLEAFKQLADVFVSIQDPQLRAAVGAAALGKSWAGAAPLLAEGGRKIGEIVEKGSQLSGMTKEMAVQADEFNDKLVLLTGTGGLLTRMVAPLLPLLNMMADDLLETQKQTKGADAGFSVLAETFRALIVLGGNVKFVFKGIGTDIGAMAAQLVALASGDWKAFKFIGKEATTDAAQARAEFDKWEASMIAVGKTAKATGETVAAVDGRAAAAAAARARAFLDEAKVAKESETAYLSLIRSINEKVAAMDRELAKLPKLTDAEKLQADTALKLADGTLKLTAAQKLNLSGLLQLLLARDRDIKAMEQQKEMTEAYAKSMQGLLQIQQEIEDAFGAEEAKIAAATLASSAYVQSIEFETAALRLSNEEREVAIALRNLELSGLLKGTIAYANAATALRKAITDQQDVRAELLKQERAAQDLADAFKNAGRGIEESLTKAFGAAGSSMGGFIKAYTSGIAQQIEIDEKYRRLRETRGADIVALDKRQQQESVENSLTMYGDMAGAAASFFDKQSDAYKVLHGIEQAMYASRLVMQLTSLGVSLGIITTETAANIASIPAKIAAGAASMFAQSGWGGFVGVAGMLAVMAGLGFASSGGGGPSMPSAADAQKAQGTGTVLGDSTAKSKSIDDALKALQQIDALGLTYTQQMTAYLANISNSMSSLVGALSRVTGITNPAQSGIAQGTSPTGIHGIVNASNSIIDPLGMFGLIPGNNAILNRIFGTITTNIINSGIAVMGTIAEAMKVPLIDNQNNIVKGINSFFTVNTTTSGLFGGKSVDHDEWRALPDGVLRQVQGFLGGIVDSVESAAKALGAWYPGLHDFLMSLPLDVKLSLDGLKGQELTDAVNAFFSSIADQIALAGLPSISTIGGLFDANEFWETFQKAGEGAFETLIRVASEFEVVQHTFAMLGLSMGATGMEAIKASDGIVQLMGGLDKFQQQTADYLSKYYSPAEQRNTTGTALGTEFSGLGVAMPASLREFRALVTSAASDTSEAGQKLFARLLELEGVFFDFTTSVIGLDGALHTLDEVSTQHADLQDRLALAQGTITQQEIANRDLLNSAIDQTNLNLANAIISQEAYNAGLALAAEGNQAQIDLRKELFDLAHTEAEVLANNRSLRMTELGLREAELHLAPGTLQAIQGQIDAQTDLNAARDREAEAVEKLAAALKVTADLEGRLGILRGDYTQQELDRAREWRAAASDTDRVLLTQIYTQEDLAAAATKANDALAAQTSLWNQFATDEQKLARATQEVNDGFAALGISVPTSGEMFADLVDSIDPATDSGQKFLEFLKQIAPAFATTMTAVASVVTSAATFAASTYQPGMIWVSTGGNFGHWEWPPGYNSTSPADQTDLTSQRLELLAQIYELTGDKAAAAAVLEQQHAIALAALDPSLRGLQTQLWGLQAAAAAAAKAAEFAKTKGQLQIDIERALGHEEIAVALEHANVIAEINKQWGLGTSQANELIAMYEQLWSVQAAAGQGLDAWKDQIRDWLKGNLLDSNLSPLTAQQQLTEAKRQYDADLLLAQGGDAAARDSLTREADQLLALMKTVNGFGGGYSALFSTIRTDLAGLIGEPGLALPTAGDNLIAGKIGQLSTELADVKVVVARLLERLIDETREQGQGTQGAVTDGADKTATAATKAAAVNERR